MDLIVDKKEVDSRVGDGFIIAPYCVEALKKLLSIIDMVSINLDKPLVLGDKAKCPIVVIMELVFFTLGGF